MAPIHYNNFLIALFKILQVLEKWSPKYILNVENQLVFMHYAFWTVNKVGGGGGFPWIYLQFPQFIIFIVQFETCIIWCFHMLQLFNALNHVTYIHHIPWFWLAAFIERMQAAEYGGKMYPICGTSELSFSDRYVLSMLPQSLVISTLSEKICR